MATFHYVPLHSSPLRRAPGRGSRELPVTERVASTLLRLPLHPLLADDDVERVIDGRARAAEPERGGGAPCSAWSLACYNEAEHLEASFAEIRETLDELGASATRSSSSTT